MKKYFFILMLAVCGRSFATEQFVRVASLSNSFGTSRSIAGSAWMNVKDDWYDFVVANPVGSGPGAYNNTFTINSARTNVVLRFDETKRKFYNNPWTLNIVYSISTYDPTGTPTTSTGQSVSIDYHPTDNFTDKAIISYDNSLKANLTITSITLTENGSGATWTSSAYKDVYLDLEQHTERCYVPVYENDIYLRYADGFNSTTPANNELSLSWNNLPWAESYDLEWMFVDMPSPTTLTPVWPQASFKNATRINTPYNFYNISLAYPRGIVYFRIRAVGKEPADCSTRFEGMWSDDLAMFDEPPADIQTSFVWPGLDPVFNWQYTASYAEDGKRKEVISYFDGSLHNRQTVTVLNTDQNAVIAETKYDYEGRGAVQMMPTPLASGGIKYYTNFNTAFSRENFDTDQKIENPDALSTTNSETDKYYSSSNALTGMFNAYIPDAENYAYSRTRFMADGTGRVKKQSGVGATFKPGSGKETRYMYSNPSSQDELDRLFG
ncbi:MAG: hypothetical protein IAF38_13380, partial [Bacteroidia bacterium]|nr:hypothetical protein [Bacteroidia bacterium]